MKKTLLFLALVLGLELSAATVPSLYLKNQFGEVSNNFVTGGSSAISVKFIVDPANSNGLGIRGLETVGGSDKVAAVYMHTNSTAATGNPNPKVGFIIVKFSKGYNGWLADSYALGSPGSSSTTNVSSGLSLGQVYVIKDVGTTTATQWQTLGLPTNFTPTISQAFTAITASAGSGTGVVVTPSPSGTGISHIEVVGGPSLNVATADNTGGQLILTTLGATSGANTAYVPVAPAANSLISLSFVLTPVAQSLQ